jgi:putative membrane protein
MFTSTDGPAERVSRFDLLTRGLIAGGCGGAVGAGTKLLGELIFPPRAPGEPIPPAVAVSRFLESMSGSPLLPEKVTLAVQGFHWGFSIGVAALYGAIVEIFPKAKFGYGIGFGMVVLLLTHETMLPFFGLSLPWSQIPLKEHLSEIFTHAIYGVSTEIVRRLVRPALFKLPGMTPPAARGV